MLRRITHPFSSRPTSLPSTIPLPFTPANFNEIKYAVTKFRNKANMAKNILLFGRMNTWITTNITNMSELFSDFIFDNINDIISGWDVSNVRNMSKMFYGQYLTFLQPLHGWNVSLVEDMSYMFSGCVSFNINLNNWNVSNVKFFQYMFYNCFSFGQPLSNWNVSKSKDMSYMFYKCYNFNRPLNSWNVTNVEDMNSMFYNCQKFNQPLYSWNISNVVDMRNMFSLCVNFNQNLNEWNVNENSMVMGMFENCRLAPEMYPNTIRQKLISQMSRQELSDLRRIQHIPPVQQQLTTAIHQQHIPPTNNKTILDKVTATPIVLSNDPIATLTPQTTMYNSIELENINVVKYLKENATNLVFYYNNAFYPINKTKLFAFTADGNKVKFKCNQVYSILYITPDKYDIANPYLMGSSFSCPCGLLLLSQIKTILNSPDQLFEIIPAGTTAPSTVSYQMTTPQANAVGASHCQEGQGANINNIVKHTIPDFPENLQEAVDVVPEIENTIGVNYKDITYKFEITPETTVGDLKQMVLDKLVLENQIDNVNKKVRFLYSGKIIQVDSQILLQIPSVAFGVTFNVLISPNVAGGTRRIKRRGKRRVTKKISRRKKTRRLKKIRHKKTRR